jgi:MSHA pilin protein MshA
MNNQMNSQKGFTLIEMVIVIVVMGILAAVAIPKFVSFTTDARVATMETLEGVVKTSANLVFAKSALEGNEDESAAKVDVAGKLVNVTFGFPVIDSRGEDELMNILETDISYTLSQEVGGDNGVILISNSEAENPAECFIRYQNAQFSGGIDGMPDVKVPFNVSSVLTGC